jgi:copper chaperone NosL
MKKIVFIVMGFFILTNLELSWAQEDVSKHPYCKYCSMERKKFAHSRVLIKYQDGSSFGACSLHCAAIDMAVNVGKAPENIRVGDYASKKLIDAEIAIWVLGGDQMGVMTKRAKWAFEDLADAQNFIKEHGGMLATFDQAIKATYEDMYHMYHDTRTTYERQKMKLMEKKKGSR